MLISRMIAPKDPELQPQIDMNYEIYPGG